MGACDREVAKWISCGDRRGSRRRGIDELRRPSWTIDKCGEVESEELLELEVLRTRRRWGGGGSGVPIKDGDWSMRRQGLKYDCRMRKSGEGGGRGCFERRRSDFFLPSALDSPTTISTLWERLRR